MTVAIQHSSGNTLPHDSANNINANLHFSVSEALTESKLLERVREFRRLSLEIASVNSDLSEQQLAHRANVMLQLKEASEQFNSLISPVDVVHMQVLQELKLEQILSKYYWHTLFLANNHPEQGKYELDSLCSKLLNAKYSLSVVGFDIVNSAVEIDADVYTDTDGQRTVTPELPSISPEVLSVVSPVATTTATAHESGTLSNPEPQSTSVPSASLSGIVSGVVTGLSALLLSVLAASVFFPEFVQKVLTLVPVGSTPYRLTMLILLLTLTTSVYLMITSIVKTNAVNENQTASTNADLFSGLIDKGVSIRRIFASAIAPILFGLGLGVATSAGFGSFGFAVFLEGMSNVLFAPLWLLLPVVTINCCVLAWFWGRVTLGVGTIMALLLTVPAIGVGATVAPNDATFMGNIIALLLGLILFAGGISLAAAAASGPDGMTALSLAAERVHNWPVALTIVLWDITAIGAGVILGGSAGIATVIGLVAVPLLIHLSLPAFRRALA